MLVAAFARDLVKLFKQLFLLLGEVDRGFDGDPAEEVSGGTRAHIFNPLPAKTKESLTLGPFRDLEGGPTVKGGDLQFAPEGGGRKANGKITVEVVAIALEDRVCLDIYLNIEITGRSPFGARLPLFGKTDLVTGIDAGGYFDRQGAALLYTTASTAFLARIADHLAGTTALGAALLNREEALLHPYLATSATPPTRFGLGAWLGTTATTAATDTKCGHPNPDLFALYRILKRELQVVAKI